MDLPTLEALLLIEKESNQKLRADLDRAWHLYYETKDKQVFFFQAALFFFILFMAKVFRFI